METAIGDQSAPQDHDLHAGTSRLDDVFGDGEQTAQIDVKQRRERHQNGDDRDEKRDRHHEAPEHTEGLPVARKRAAGGQKHDDWRLDEDGQGKDQSEGGELDLGIGLAANHALNPGAFDGHEQPGEEERQPENQHFAIGHGGVT